MPVVVSGMTMDGWARSRSERFSDRFLEKAYKEGLVAKDASESATAEVKTFAKGLCTKAEITGLNLEETQLDVQKHSDGIIKYSTEMTKPNLSQQEVSELKVHLDYHKDMQSEAVSKQAEYIKELHDISTSEPDILKSDLSDFFINLVNICRDYIDILSSEQKVILFNLCGYTILVMVVTSITLMIIGQDLINYYQLEFKYPKLAEYINLQLTLRQYYLKFYIVYFYFLVLVLISCNVFMFTYDYFAFLYM